MPPKKKQFVYPIESEEQFLEITENAAGPLALIDCHLDWCGPCEAIVPNYATLWYNYDNPEVRLSFWQCNEEFLPEKLKEDLKLSVVPRFLIYSGGKLKAEINGVRYNDIENAIGEHIPEDPDDV